MRRRKKFNLRETGAFYLQLITAQQMDEEEFTHKSASNRQFCQTTKWQEICNDGKERPVNVYMLTHVDDALYSPTKNQLQIIKVKHTTAKEEELSRKVPRNSLGRHFVTQTQVVNPFSQRDTEEGMFR